VDVEITEDLKKLQLTTHPASLGKKWNRSNHQRETAWLEDNSGDIDEATAIETEN
jgi:hypothetical protein